MMPGAETRHVDRLHRPPAWLTRLMGGWVESSDAYFGFVACLETYRVSDRVRIADRDAGGSPLHRILRALDLDGVFPFSG